MSDLTFRTQAKKSLELTAQGIELLIEVSELQESLLNQPASSEVAEQIISEIAGKEKQAVGAIQRATQIQRELMRSQHETIRKLAERL